MLKSFLEVGEIAHWLRPCAVLIEDQSSSPSSKTEHLTVLVTTALGGAHAFDLYSTYIRMHILSHRKKKAMPI